MENQNQLYPHEWICPITQQLMKDPVIADDGFSYEKISIQNWFQTSNISPITGLPLSTTKLIPNRALKNTIEQFFENLEGKNQNLSNSQIKQEKNKQVNIKQQIKQAKKQIQEKIELKAYFIENQSDQDHILNLQIIPPQKINRNNRKPISLVCILDTSESMNIDAVKDAKDNESHGFSRLDLVRHSMNTLIQFMNEGDQLTLIIFNTAAQCILHTTKMNNAGKKAALNKIKQLQGNGTTNIWEGLRISLEMLKKINHKDKNVFTILLTDGQPNLNPPRGIVPTLKKYIQIQQLSNPNIHVFGYGYELDTKLLEDIARKGAGTYAYIPDCSMVGTVFINFMANCLSTVTNRAELQIQLSNGSKIKQIIGFSQLKPNIYNLGCIQYGQKRDICIKYPKNVLKQGSIKLSFKYGSSMQEQNILQITQNIEVIKANHNQNIETRVKYLELLKNCIGYGQKFELALTDIKTFYYSLQKSIKNQYIEALMKELKFDNDQNLGQVEKAFLKLDWYKKWGKNYVPSLLLAHLMQVCTNFKDPLLQLYGGQLFKKYQNQMDTIFIKMLPPKPSAKKQKNIVYKPAPVNMSDYYNHYGGCIDGQCEVKVWKINSQGQEVFQLQKLKNVKKDDIVGNSKTKIQCMVETRVFSYVQMVKLEKLVITPWHPILYRGKWTFPIDLQNSEMVYVQAYYNFVTQQNKNLQIQDFECISLGHQITQNSVTSHEYLSSKQVIQDLKISNQNYSQGLVVIRNVKRDESTGRISKFIVQ